MYLNKEQTEVVIGLSFVAAVLIACIVSIINIQYIEQFIGDLAIVVLVLAVFGVLVCIVLMYIHLMDLNELRREEGVK